MQAWGSRAQSPELARLKPWDAANPLVLRDSVAAPAKLKTKRMAFNIGNDAVELYQNLYACLRVGRLDRGAVILDRLVEVYAKTAPELLDAHSVYLQTLFDLELADPKPESMANLEQWYEDKMVRRQIEPSAPIFVTLLRAVMNFLDDTKEQAKAMQKYVAMVHQYGQDMVDDVNSSSEFTDEEWDILIRAQPAEYAEPPPVNEVQEALVNTPAARKSLQEHGLVYKEPLKINPVPQKGHGLDSLQQALGVFESGKDILYPQDPDMSREAKDKVYAYARQLRMEQDALDAAVERWKLEDEKLQDMGIHGVLNTKPVQAIMYNWYTALVPLWKKEIARAKQIMSESSAADVHDSAHVYGVWLERCKPERLAALTVSRVVTAGIIRPGTEAQQSTYKISSLSVNIGSDVQDYINADLQAQREAWIRKQRKQFRKDMISRLHKTEAVHKTETAEEAEKEAKAKEVAFPTQKMQMSLDVKTRIGALALELIMQAATITVSATDPKSGEQVYSNQAAFTHRIGYHIGRRVGYMIPHPQFLTKLRNESVAHVDAVRLPMLVEPKPWMSFEEGGYYTIPQRVVRQKAGDPGQRAYAESAIDNGDMTKVLAGLDVLGKVPWQINTPVLEVMAEAWNNGDGIGGLVAENTILERPADPPADATYQERVKWGRKVQEYENFKAGLHSQRCYQNFQLETARAFAKEPSIYFPHSVDFRGRAYPIPPTLNHIGSDVARGLLKFANAKELGTVGLQWLKIHLANLYGFDKASLREREQFAMDNLANIYDSATNPLSGERWWTKAEDPWQCLACCIELKNAFDSPDPTRFKSQLPVHQDGTCNGLQHYAALGGDHAGARQVNLEPSDRPQDIYTGVAELVKGMVAEDAKKGLPTAVFINGRITRKVVKRTVMTNVYGVTFMGAKAQVEDELRDMFPNFKETDKIKTLGTVALYIAYKIFEALGKIFNGAQEIQYWLGECGDRITTSLTPEQVQRIGQRENGQQLTYDSKYKMPKKPTKSETAHIQKSAETFRTSIIWTTPLKMPVVQPYRKDSVTKVKAKLQDITVVKRSTSDAVDKRKQLQAFPPNFIHSLDASHMTLSALKCSELGLDFAAVHDSFWTHASDIPNLNVVLRDAFVRMHSEDIIGRLFEEFKARYAGSMYLATIKSNSIVGRLIREWRIQHFHSTGRKAYKDADAKRGNASFEELALEVKRQELLASDDLAKVQQGQEMTTPTSIWLDHQDPKALTSQRLSLLGETKDKDSSLYEETRDKVLTHEAEVLAENKPEAVVPDTSTEAAESVAELAKEMAEEGATDDMAEPRPMKSLRDKGQVQAWIPLTFPAPPKKGDWDISRLRESKYFFS
jgi:DNA-directed RNA polymerase